MIHNYRHKVITLKPNLFWRFYAFLLFVIALLLVQTFYIVFVKIFDEPDFNLRKSIVGIVLLTLGFLAAITTVFIIGLLVFKGRNDFLTISDKGLTMSLHPANSHYDLMVGSYEWTQIQAWTVDRIYIGRRRAYVLIILLAGKKTEKKRLRYYDLSSIEGFGKKAKGHLMEYAPHLYRESLPIVNL